MRTTFVRQIYTAEMNLQMRIELAAQLGQYILSNESEWQEAKQKATLINPWFIPEFTDTAVKNIAHQFLDQQKLINWAASYTIQPLIEKKIGIVMAGNIPLVGFHDFLCVFISGHKAIIKAASKDEVLIKHLVEKLKEWNSEINELVVFHEMLKDCDAYIATGSNNSARYFEYYFSKYAHIIRRNGTSVAVLDGSETNDELEQLPAEKKDAGEHEYYLNNPSFLAGDGEYCYNVIRHFKPQKIIEIGCGYSTLICLKAEKKNEQPGSGGARHICIEPYEMPWLENLAVEVIRKKVEEIDIAFFSSLEANDILFIDSSHMIRPQGDVLFEFLEILPVLKPGVLVHIHDIFTPRDYPREWVVDKHCMWNEQYLLEAFLTFNTQFRILGAVNFLKHNHKNALEAKCPNSAKMPDDEPGSFWIIRN